jgi:hypothetical protein
MLGAESGRAVAKVLEVEVETGRAAAVMVEAETRT